MPLPRVVSHTVQAVTASDITLISITRTAAGRVDATAHFDLKDAGGVVVDQGSFTTTLEGAPLTSLVNFINANFVPGMNAQ